MKRYEKYAAAQALLTDKKIVIQRCSSTGAATVVLAVPFSEPSIQTGTKGSTYLKYVEVQDEPLLRNNTKQAMRNGKKEKKLSQTKTLNKIQRR